MNSKKDLPNFTPRVGKQKLSFTVAPGQFSKGAYKLKLTLSTDEEIPNLVDVASSEYGVDMPIIQFVDVSEYKKGKFYMNAKWQHDEPD
jgi:hypothetical protein